jgi:hypothetical protein
MTGEPSSAISGYRIAGPQNKMLIKLLPVTCGRMETYTQKNALFTKYLLFLAAAKQVFNPRLVSAIYGHRNYRTAN